MISEFRLDFTLKQLENAELVRRAHDIDPSYLFKHTLTQETTYASILKTRRTELHRRVANAYEQLYVDRLDEFAAPLAQHYAEACDDVKTLEYSIRAGDAAMRIYAHTESIMHYSRAIEIARRTETDQLKYLFLKRGRANELCGQYSEALANYKEMQSLALERNDRGLELAAVMARATLHATPTSFQDLELGQTLLDGALALARDLNDRAAESKALWNLMILEYFVGRPVKSIEYGERALAIARELKLKEQTAFVLNDISRNYAALGRKEDCFAALEEARELWQDLDNLPMLIDNLGTSADNAMSFGDYPSAVSLAEQAYRLSIKIGNLWNQAYSRWILGGIYFDQGKIDDAIRALTETMQLGDQSGFAIAAWVSRVILALLYGTMGLPARGIELLEPLAAQVRHSDVPFRAWGLGVLSFLYLRVGNLAQAESFIEEARRDANRDDLGNMVAIILALSDGEIFMSQQRYDQIEPLTRSLLEQYHSAKLHLFKADVMLLAGRALHAQGKIDAAREMLTQARVEAETIGVQRVLWEILAELSVLESECSNEAQAQSLRDQANRVIEYIAAHCPSEIRESFLNLPSLTKIINQ